MTRRAVPPITDALPISVRAYGVREGKRAPRVEFSARGPSPWFLVFDCETTTDETQRLRIGAYQLREGDKLREQGLFFNPDAVTRAEIRLITEYATAKRLRLMRLREFLDKVFVLVAFHWQATVIGFNVPFDLARIAEGHSHARGKMRPGFSFETQPDKKGPRIRIKHISRACLMEFSGPGQRLPRGQTKRRVMAPLRRPAFVDVATLAHALLSDIFTLGRLAKFLNTPHQKLDTDEHGKALKPEYLDYACQDVQVTWECFVELRKRFDIHALAQTPIHRVYSEASIGKGYLREMTVRGWREMQPDFPPMVLGKIMGGYFGGRTEVHQRRVVAQVLYCDFTSMYPTVSTLMGLWPFVIAKGMTWRDATAETRAFVNRVTLADLQKRETWRRFHVIVQIEPHDDILPVRAKYQYEPLPFQDRMAHYTIGLNHVTSGRPLWYALPDVIASKLPAGRAPKILKAIAFEPKEPQDGLRPVTIAGKREFWVDPLKEDFFKRLIELRMQTKGQDRNVLKLVANAMGYGIFVQQNVQELAEPVAVHCYPATGREFLVDMDQVEQPGEFFHPLLGTLITSAARLMLAITERLVFDAGLDWAFCDTDSMAIAKPAGMDNAEFHRRAETVRTWFNMLNPYGVPVELFKTEDVNFCIVDGEPGTELEPLYCYAISSKRYVLFNIDAKGASVIRKATAHGLGHLLAPFVEIPPGFPEPVVPLDKIGVNAWQYCLWICILRAVLAGSPDRPEYSALPNFSQPAVTKYAATTPHLLAWFESYNRDKPYAEQVRPFGFMVMFQPDPLADWEAWRAANGLEPANGEPPCVIAPYDRDPLKAANRCFDRDSGKLVPANMLLSYAHALARYHLRPESKFMNADYTDAGTTQRRHVKVQAIINIGKEANRWEEQSYVGTYEPEEEFEYGLAPEDQNGELRDARKAADEFGQRALAKAAGISLQHLSAILTGNAKPTETMLAKITRAVEMLRYERIQAQRQAHAILECARAACKSIGLQKFARLTKIDAGNLSAVLSGKRRPSKMMVARLERHNHAVVCGSTAQPTSVRLRVSNRGET
ncbi:MAG: helix-turn-helix domain-containing protein [Rhizomicrobium sp.]